MSPAQGVKPQIHRTEAERAGRVVILNGAPRSGKSSIVRAMQETFDTPWINLGVDVHVREMTPARYQPGIGLRPGGERPDLEPLIPVLFAALYDSIAAHSRLGLNVVVDVGHHDAHSTPGDILGDCARRLSGVPALLVGVRCPIDVIMARRRQGQAGREGLYVTAPHTDPTPAPVLAWQREVHRPGLYDLEVDTSSASPEQCAAIILHCLRETDGRGTALPRLASGVHQQITDQINS